ncbi:envelope stress response membrane protein PspB [Neptunomonas concharum]|jgi:phage shock protein B|uniref:Envelope stress response membrane protein PspB n=1 Tax=Neptunomonas concharum TaxID=1031538 RepID=A0A5P1R993_9GAMM|nr:envelope stress response membrane protein PspB [Neptunomonas concharum]QEQ96167.1 envelope stress response membrane protein PspB [Neptunomonas concharum]
MSNLVFFFVPTVIFLGLVLPLWLLLHYIGQWRSSKGLSAEDRHTLETALAEVSRLESRLETLETILDAEQPEWRKQHSSES